MSQHDYDITTTDANTGTLMRAAINTALQALAGCSSGGTEPGTRYPYMFWADTTSGLMKQRNAANSAWITLFTLATGPANAAGSASQPFAAANLELGNTGFGGAALPSAYPLGISMQVIGADGTGWPGSYGTAVAYNLGSGGRCTQVFYKVSGGQYRRSSTDGVDTWNAWKQVTEV